MAKYPIWMLGGPDHFATWFGPHPYDIVLANLALVALLLGPLALLKSARTSRLLRAPAPVEATRAMFALSWAVSSYVTVMTFVYV